MILGHESTIKVIDQALAHNRLPHALILKGPKGIGKYSLASELASYFLHRPENLSFSQFLSQDWSFSLNPDLLILSEDELKVENIRNLVDFFHKSSFYGRGKVAIIDGAQNMNTAAANALLKTLEEPSTNSLIILVSHGDDLLLTLNSRCMSLQMKSLSTSLMRKILTNQNLGPVKEEFLDMSCGSFDLYQALSQNIEAQSLLNLFPLLHHHTNSQGLRDIQSLYSKNKEVLSWVFRLWPKYLSLQSDRLDWDIGSYHSKILTLAQDQDQLNLDALATLAQIFDLYVEERKLTQRKHVA